MALYYVTGTPGSGKSTVLAELERRSYEAHDVDELAAFYHTETGRKTSTGQTAEERTPEWRNYHEWKVPVEKVDALQKQSTHKTIFLCGVAANDSDFWNKFTRVFCLYVPPHELERRLTDRPGSSFGKNPHELASALEWAGYAKQQYTDLGAVIIDATQPFEAVTDEILRQTHAH